MIGRLALRISQSHLNHRRIAAGAFWVGLLVLAAKLFVAAREMAIAWRYGVSGTVDAYQLALTITTWLPTTIAAIATVVLVPPLVALRRKDAAYAKFVAELNGAFLLTAVAAIVVTYLAAEVAMSLLAGGLGPQVKAATVTMARSMAPVAGLSIAAGLLTIRLQARERFAYSLTEAMPALVITVLVLVLPSYYRDSPLVWGTAAGMLLQCVVLVTMVRGAEGGLGGLRMRHSAPEWRLVYGPLMIMGIGQVLITLTLPIDQAFAASSGEGAVAGLGYATRIVTLVTTFGSVVVARALLPVLADVAADGEMALGRSHTLKWSLLMAGFGTAAALIGWFVAPTLVQLLFQRGAFTGEQTAFVATILRYGMLQLPPFFAGIVLVQWYASTNMHKVLLASTALALATKIALNALLIQPMGVAGIMISSAAMYTVTTLLMMAMMRHKSGGAAH